MNAIKELESFISTSEVSITPVINDIKQFERNIYLSYICNYFNTCLHNLRKHRDYLGIEVYKYVKGFNYVSLEEYQNESYAQLNPISKTPVIFTEELYDVFEKEYIDFLIKRYNKNLLDMIQFNNEIDSKKIIELKSIVYYINFLNYLKSDGSEYIQKP
jgi:hypothetical protein